MLQIDLIASAGAYSSLWRLFFVLAFGFSQNKTKIRKLNYTMSRKKTELDASEFHSWIDEYGQDEGRNKNNKRGIHLHIVLAVGLAKIWLKRVT